MKKTALAIAVVLVALAGAAVWWQRTPLLAWYYVRGLTHADQDSREAWANRVAGLDIAALPRLLDCLQETDPAVCDNMAAGLIRLGERWEPEDNRALDLAEELQSRFDRFSSGGQASALQVIATLLRRSPERCAPPRLSRTAGDLLTATAGLPELRPHVLDLAGALIDHVQPGQWREVGQDLASQGLRDNQPENRIRAVDLCLHLARAAEPGLLKPVVPLLRDPVPAVRRAAVLAVGPSREAVADDELLPLLHDLDAEVCRLVELALRSRGLQESHILLARLISDERAGRRLQVLDHLHRATDLEPGVWLARLSQDPAPAVRAAAIRAACAQPQLDFRDRIRQMAQQDPSPTVRQLAVFYLSRQMQVHEE
jgi:hypothetical protein